MDLIDKYQTGIIVYGRVSGIRPYGAFVNFEGGISGLIHISELSNGFVRDIGSFVKVGDYVFCKIIDIDRKQRQLRLSYKALKRNRRSSRYKAPFLGLPEQKIGFQTIAEMMPIWLQEEEKC